MTAIHTNLFPMTLLQSNAGLMRVAAFTTDQSLKNKAGICVGDEQIAGWCNEHLNPTAVDSWVSANFELDPAIKHQQGRTG